MRPCIFLPAGPSRHEQQKKVRRRGDENVALPQELSKYDMLLSTWRREKQGRLRPPTSTLRLSLFFVTFVTSCSISVNSPRACRRKVRMIHDRPIGHRVRRVELDNSHMPEEVDADVLHEPARSPWSSSWNLLSVPPFPIVLDLAASLLNCRHCLALNSRLRTTQPSHPPITSTSTINPRTLNRRNLRQVYETDLI